MDVVDIMNSRQATFLEITKATNTFLKKSRKKVATVGSVSLSQGHRDRTRVYLHHTVASVENSCQFVFALFSYHVHLVESFFSGN